LLCSDTIDGEYNETEADGSLRRVDTFFDTGYNTTITHAFSQTAVHDGVNKPVSGWMQNDRQIHLFFHNFQNRLEYDPVISLAHDTRLVRVEQATGVAGVAGVAVGLGVAAGLTSLIAIVVGAAVYVRKRGLPGPLRRLFGNKTTAQPEDNL